MTEAGNATLGKTSLDVGDRSPNFVLPDVRGTFTMFYERTRGLPVILLFASPGRWPAHRALLDRFAEQAEAFRDAAVDIFCVSLDASDPNREALPFLVWSDREQKISQWYFGQLGLAWPPEPGEAGVLALGLDANQRLLWSRRGGGPDMADEILAGLRQRPEAPKPEVHVQWAPVLMVPRVLGQSALPPGSPPLDAAAIEEPVMQQRLVALIGGRIAPELYKAFGFQGFRFGRLQLLTSADSGTPPPETPTPDSRAGRFVVLLGLPGDSEGSAAVRFPEYGGHCYPLPEGGALVFSQALVWQWQAEEPPTRYLQSILTAASR